MSTESFNQKVLIPFPSHKMTIVNDTTPSPYIFIGRLALKFGNMEAHGTGTLIGNKHVLTAAHNLYNKELGKVTEVTFSPGQNGINPKYGPYKMKRYFVTEEYKTSPAPYMDGNVLDVSQYMYDYAIIELETGVFGEGLSPIVLSTEQLNANETLISGYPALPDNLPQKTMWESRGKIKAEEDAPFLLYQISTIGGQSGSAVLQKKEDNHVITGIHVAGSVSLETNVAVRITDEVIEQIRTWIAQR